MARVLITGANSFVGTNFRKFSQHKDVEEISLFEIRPEDIEFEKFDIVLHLAAIVHQSKIIPEHEYLCVNRDLCLRVAENAKKRGIKQFIFLSTLKVYGDSVNGSQLRDENSECFPDDAYGKSKYAAEIGLRKIEDKKFTVSIIRTPLVYGEGVKANMINLIKLVDTCPILPFGGINNKRNFTFAENLIGYIDRIIELKASGIFITMDDTALSTTELITFLSEFLGRKVRLFKLSQFLIRIGSFLVPEIFERLYNSLEFDNHKTKEVLNYKPPFSTKDGLKSTVSYYQACKKQ